MSSRKQQYTANKNTKVGENIICPICSKQFVKKQWQQAFCSLRCKDAYHNSKGDRHKKGYYTEYNKKHPERLERGFTKDFINGNVSQGKENECVYIDSLGRLCNMDFYNPTMTDLIESKLNVWHDDDWCEDGD